MSDDLDPSFKCCHLVNLQSILYLSDDGMPTGVMLTPVDHFQHFSQSQVNNPEARGASAKRRQAELFALVLAMTDVTADRVNGEGNIGGIWTRHRIN